MKLIRLSQSTNKLIEEHRLKKQLKQILLLLKKQKLSRFAKRKLKLAKELTLIFVSPIEQKKLNYKFRKKNKPTDVLSFAPVEAASLGELAICFAMIKKDAVKNQISTSDQLLYIFIHGILHLLGYDHEIDDKSAQHMYALQDVIFEEMRTKWQ